MWDVFHLWMAEVFLVVSPNIVTPLVLPTDPRVCPCLGLVSLCFRIQSLLRPLPCVVVCGFSPRWPWKTVPPLGLSQRFRVVGFLLLHAFFIFSYLCALLCSLVRPFWWGDPWRRPGRSKRWIQHLYSVDPCYRVNGQWNHILFLIYNNEIKRELHDKDFRSFWEIS